MRKAVALAVFAIALLQVKCLEEPSEKEVGEFKELVREWSEKATRIIRSLESAPGKEAAGVSAQLEAALAQARAKRDAPSDSSSSSSTGTDGLQQLFANVNEGLKSFMSNVSSSPFYQQFQKLGEGFGEKGKELFGKIEEQVKNFNKQDKPST